MSLGNLIVGDQDDRVVGNVKMLAFKCLFLFLREMVESLRKE